MKSSVKKLFQDDVKAIFKFYKVQMIWIGILCGFLLFLLNILVGISMYGQEFNANVQTKLGMYFYIKDDPAYQGQIDKQVMEIRDALKNAGLEVRYSTKDDALKFMQNSLPELSGSLEKFWVSNPLPATLYVVFHNQGQYATLQQIITQHQDTFQNVQEFSQLDDLEQQENRILHIIQLSNFIQLLCWILVAVLAIVILSFAIFFLKWLFATFRDDIQVKKLLWATKRQIIRPFLASIAYVVIWGFVLAFILVGTSLFVLDYYMMLVMQYALIPHLMEEWSSVLAVVGAEIIVIMGPLMAISYRFISTLHKKLK